MLDSILYTLVRQLTGITRAWPNLRDKGVPFGYDSLVVHGRGPSSVVLLDKVVTVPSRNGVEELFVGVQVIGGPLDKKNKR